MTTKVRTRILLAMLCAAAFTGCAATGSKATSYNNASWNLEESTTANHNPLLPPSYYDSNHLIDD